MLFLLKTLIIAIVRLSQYRIILFLSYRHEGRRLKPEGRTLKEEELKFEGKDSSMMEGDSILKGEDFDLRICRI